MDSDVSEQIVLQGNIGRTYKLLELLGDGLTAQVFRAQADNPDEEVAVKALRPGLEESIVKRFESEHRMVAAVWDALRAEPTGASGPNGLDDSPATPPQSYEFCAARDQQPAFVAMELMPGRKVEWLLAERGAFPELLGLRLGLQLFGLLHILHGRMKRSYDDFKFENLWWEAETQRLRVTDWNVLGEEKDLAAKAPWDLERGARALLRVLTGAPLRPELRLDQQPGWDKLSVGAQVLLRRMLDLEKQRRPQSAEEVCKELSLLIGYWRIEPGRGLRNAEAALDGIAEGQEAADLDEAARRRIEPTVRQVLAALSILHLRYPQEVEGAPAAWPAELVQRLDALQARAEQYAPSPERMVSTALSLLGGSSFPAAAAKLRDAVKLFPDHLPAHRWLELAEMMAAGKARAEGENNRWRDAIKRCEDGDLEAAKDVLANLPEAFAVALRLEVAVRLALKGPQSDTAQTETALQGVRQAREALKGMRDKQQPAYAAAVQESLGVNLEAWEQSLVKQAEAEQRRRAVANEVREFTTRSTPSRLAEGVARAEEWLHLFLDEPEVVKAVLQLGEKCLEAKEYHLAARVFYTGAVLDHDRAPAFRLRWLVAHAAYMHSNVETAQSLAEVDRARAAVMAAYESMDSGSPEAAKTLSLLTPLVAKERTPITELLEVTLKEALKTDRAAASAVIGKQLGTSHLAVALDNALKGQDLTRLDTKARTALDGIAQTHAGLSPAVLSVLKKYYSAQGKSLAQAKDETSAREEIARALDLPYSSSVTLVKNLLSPISDNTRLILARQWRDMAYDCGAEQLEKPVPRPLPVPDPGPRPAPKPNPEPKPQPTPVPNPLPAPQDSNARLMEALNSNDPRRWHTVIDTPVDQRASWSDVVRNKARQRNTEILAHKREMEDLLRGLGTDPKAAANRFQAWLPNHSWVCCWDPKKADWVDVEQIQQTVERAVATREAQDLLREAQRRRNAGESFERVITAIDQGLAFNKAEAEVVQDLRRMKAHLAPVDRGGIHGGSMSIVDHSSNRTTSSAGDNQRDTLRRMLERHLDESKTLTELRERLQGLLQSSTIHAQTIKAQYDSLRIWEREEIWLQGVEGDRNKGERLDERTKSHAAQAIKDIDALTKMDHWRPYIPTDRATVFATTKGRLQVIAAQQRVAARRPESSSHTSY